MEEHPYGEALRLDAMGETRAASDWLAEADRTIDPLAYDEARAEIELGLGQYGLAAEIAARTLKAGRETPRLHLIAAGAQFQMTLFEEAKAHLAAVTGDDARASNLRARLAYHEQRFEDAWRHADRAVELWPGWDSPRWTGLAARSAGGDRSAQRVLQSEWERTHDGLLVEFLLRDAFERKDGPALDALAREVAERAMWTASSLSMILWRLIDRRDWDAAIKAFDAAPEAAKDNAYNVCARGRALVGKGDRRAALPFLERAFEMEPANPGVWRPYFNALHRTGQTAKVWRLTEDSTQALKRQSVEGFSWRGLRNTLRDWFRRRR